MIVSPPPPIRGILFDLWNTLAFNDYRPNPINSLARAIGVLGTPGWTKIIERGMMLAPLPGIREGILSLCAGAGVSLSAPEREALEHEWVEACRQTRLFDDVLPTLLRLRPRFRLGLLSNTQSFDLGFLDEHGVTPFLDARVFSFEEGRLKPDPRLFEVAAARMGLPVPEVLMVGDNLRDDVEGAQKVGMKSVFIRREGVPLTFHETHPPPEALSGLESLVNTLGV